MRDFAKLIPELKTWNQGEGIDVDEWIGCISNFEHMIGYCAIFWPEFALHEDCVMFADFDKKDFGGFLENYHGNKNAVEQTMNHWHIIDLFSMDKPKPTKDQITFLGRTLKEIWEAKLKRDFPNRNIVVVFNEDDCVELIDYSITFYHDQTVDGGQ